MADTWKDAIALAFRRVQANPDIRYRVWKLDDGDWRVGRTTARRRLGERRHPHDPYANVDPALMTWARRFAAEAGTNRCPACGQPLYSPAETEVHHRQVHNVGPTASTSWGAEP